MGSVALPVPPPAQGGTEWIAYYQALGLSNKGHEVILFAAKGSSKNFQNTKVKVVEVGGGNVVAGSAKEKKFGEKFVESSRKLRLEVAYLAMACNKLIEYKDQYDVILNNMRGEGVFLPVAKLLNKPFANVMHLNIFPELAELFKEYDAKIITISNSQRKNFPDLNYLATVYNCVNTEKFVFNDKPKDYLLMMGSIGRHKNQGDAIKAAKELGMKLIIAGKISDKEYYEEIKKDIDGEQIKWLGEIGFDEKLKLYQNAKAFLFPILWEEPFGLVMIEAMSCGTPVVAYKNGATPEVIVDILTGYLIDNYSQMAEAVKKISKINRQDCRKHVEENFTVEKMVDGYDKVLRNINKRAL